MKFRMVGVAVLSLAVAGVAFAGSKKAQKAEEKKAAKKPEMAFTVSGPYETKNLSVFLIHGEDRVKDKTFLTLDEALEKKKIVVHETGTVSELAVENVSTTEEIYIQAGDIVKGGKQDRVLTVDVIIPSKSGKVPLASFCVEQGRWAARSGDSVEKFESSKQAASSKKLKMAFRKGSQGNVWKEVAATQKKLSKAAGKNVADDKSATSLQLTLENKDVAKLRTDYVKALKTTPDGKKDVIGYAVAVNGEVSSADVYANNALFVKLWDKLLASSVNEAIGESDGKTKAAPKPAAVADIIRTEGKRTRKKINSRVDQLSFEDDALMMYDTVDAESGETVRKSILVK